MSSFSFISRLPFFFVFLFIRHPGCLFPYSYRALRIVRTSSRRFLGLTRRECAGAHIRPLRAAAHSKSNNSLLADNALSASPRSLYQPNDCVCITFAVLATASAHAWLPCLWLSSEPHVYPLQTTRNNKRRTIRECGMRRRNAEKEEWRKVATTRRAAPSQVRWFARSLLSVPRSLVSSAKGAMKTSPGAHKTDGFGNNNNRRNRFAGPSARRRAGWKERRERRRHSSLCVRCGVVC